MLIAGAQSEKAEGLFQSMLSKRCKPNSMTYSALLLAHIRADQWRSALQACGQPPDLLYPVSCTHLHVNYSLVLSRLIVACPRKPTYTLLPDWPCLAWTELIIIS